MLAPVLAARVARMTTPMMTLPAWHGRWRADDSSEFEHGWQVHVRPNVRSNLHDSCLSLLVTVMGSLPPPRHSSGVVLQLRLKLWTVSGDVWL